MNSRETRAFTAELRIQGGGDTPSRIVGHAALFNSLSEDLGGFREQIAPGAFSDSIKSDDVRALFNHSPDYILGRTASGTLTLSEDDDGLVSEIDPPNTQFVRDLMVSIERGDISQMSFAFRVKPDGQTWEERDEMTLRTLTNVTLYDVSPVTFPAYPETDVGVRSMQAYHDTLHDAQRRIASAHRERKLYLLGIT